MTKYFIEHKENHKWVTYNGELTNDPNDDGIISFNEDWLANRWLRELYPTISSDFSGRVTTVDTSIIDMQLYLKRQIFEKNGADLFSDFIITEHLFV